MWNDGLAGYLSQHVQIEMLRRKAFCLIIREPQRLIHRLYLQLPKDTTLKRGYKNTSFGACHPCTI
jgi:hypothetical protein